MVARSVACPLRIQPVLGSTLFQIFKNGARMVPKPNKLCLGGLTGTVWLSTDRPNLTKYYDRGRKTKTSSPKGNDRSPEGQQVIEIVPK